jgi:hypothetical protein
MFFDDGEDPFSRFGGGHRHGGGGGQSKPTKPVDTNGYYETLGLTKETADKNSINSAYKKLAAKWHPDRKGGDAEKVCLFLYLCE